MTRSSTRSAFTPADNDSATGAAAADDDVLGVKIPMSIIITQHGRRIISIGRLGQGARHCQGIAPLCWQMQSQENAVIAGRRRPLHIDRFPMLRAARINEAAGTITGVRAIADDL